MEIVWEIYSLLEFWKKKENDGMADYACLHGRCTDANMESHMVAN